MIQGKITKRGFEIYFWAEREEATLDRPDPPIEWQITAIFDSQSNLPFSAPMIKDFEAHYEEYIDKAITTYCLNEKEKSDESFALRNV